MLFRFKLHHQPPLSPAVLSLWLLHPSTLCTFKSLLLLLSPHLKSPMWVHFLTPILYSVAYRLHWQYPQIHHRPTKRQLKTIQSICLTNLHIREVAPVWTTATTSQVMLSILTWILRPAQQLCESIPLLFWICQYPKLPYQPLPTITVRRALLCRNIWGLIEENSFSFSTLKSINRLCFGLDVDKAVRFSPSTFLKKDSWRITVINCLVFFSRLIGCFVATLFHKIVFLFSILTAFSLESPIICWFKRKSTYLIIKNSFISRSKGHSGSKQHR